MEIRDLLLMCIEKNASDLHLTENEPPILRIDGRLLRTNLGSVNKQDLKKMLYSVLSNAQKEIFERDLELDFSLALPGLDRFRVNFHLQKGSVEGAFRRIPVDIPTVDKLGLPQIIMNLARKPNGLVLVPALPGWVKLLLWRQ